MNFGFSVRLTISKGEATSAEAEATPTTSLSTSTPTASHCLRQAVANSTSRSLTCAEHSRSSVVVGVN